jgi:flagellar FliL protein
VAEEKKEEAKAAPAAPAPAVTSSGGGGGGPKPIILIAIAVLNMISMGAVAFILWSSHKAEQKKPKIDDVIEGVHKEDSERDPASVNKEDIVGKLIPMETFLVNLAGSRGSKLVKMNIELELENEAVMSEIEKRKPQIRDIIIIILSSKNYDQIVTKEGKDALRDEVRDTVNSFLTKGHIKRVYFTEFIVN